MSGVELAEDICSRLDDILIEESPMHPFGCATWEESSRIAIDMAKDFIRRAVSMEAVAWREKVEHIVARAITSYEDDPSPDCTTAKMNAVSEAADAILQALALIPQAEET